MLLLLILLPFVCTRSEGSTYVPWCGSAGLLGLIAKTLVIQIGKRSISLLSYISNVLFYFITVSKFMLKQLFFLFYLILFLRCLFCFDILNTSGGFKFLYI